MAKLTEPQLIILSKAAQRDDGAAVVPRQMNRAAATKVGASLVSRKLMREIRSKPGMPVWRKDEDDRPMSLVIMRSGREAIGVEDDAGALEPAVAPKGGRTAKYSVPHRAANRAPARNRRSWSGCCRRTRA